MHGLKMKYFVLNPSSSDPIAARAARQAMRKYAEVLDSFGRNGYAQELRDWADAEEAVESTKAD